MLTLEQQGVHLQRVSRTFALTIPVLPMPLADWVGNAYLLCRIVDTIEDDAHLSCTDKQQHIDAYMSALQGGGDVALWSRQLATSLSPITPAGERELIADIPAVLARLYSFPSSVQQILIQGVSIMSRGMSVQQAQSQIAERGDLDRYCYHVAGVVGELLTELFSVYRPSLSRQKCELLPLAVSFGEGLQLTNILKDVQEDALRGVCWLPQQELAAIPRSVEAMELPPQLMDEYVALAHGHLQDAVRFTLKLPRAESGMRQFCLWAIGMALLTLRRVHRNPQCHQSTRVKISRRQVKGVIITCKLAGWSNTILAFYFKCLGHTLPLTLRDVDELHHRVSAWRTLQP